ncbi:hypothetical protein J6590_034741, partial [Homalodisca vitripennis]
MWWVCQQVDGSRQGGPGDAQENVHPPRLSQYGRAMDAESCLLPQTEAHQQHLRQARLSLERTAAAFTWRKHTPSGLLISWRAFLRTPSSTSAQTLCSTCHLTPDSPHAARPA